MRAIPPVTALCENCVDEPAVTEHSVHELAKPAPVARIEVNCAPLEGTVEHVAAADVGADLRWPQHERVSHR
jgi:hypothetical protein